MAGTNHHRGPGVWREDVQKIRPLLRKECSALAVVKMHDGAERNLPDSAKPIRCAFHEEEKK
jgi:hypothetical protein